MGLLSIPRTYQDIVHQTTFERLRNYALDRFSDKYKCLPDHSTFIFEDLRADDPVARHATKVVPARLIVGHHKHNSSTEWKGFPSPIYVYLCAEQQITQVIVRLSSKTLTPEMLPDAHFQPPFDAIVQYYGNSERALQRIGTMASYYFLAAGHVGEIISRASYRKAFAGLCEKVLLREESAAERADDEASINTLVQAQTSSAQGGGVVIEELVSVEVPIANARAGGSTTEQPLPSEPLNMPDENSNGVGTLLRNMIAEGTAINQLVSTGAPPKQRPVQTATSTQHRRSDMSETPRESKRKVVMSKQTERHTATGSEILHDEIYLIDAPGAYVGTPPPDPNNPNIATLTGFIDEYACMKEENAGLKAELRALRIHIHKLERQQEEANKQLQAQNGNTTFLTPASDVVDQEPKGTAPKEEEEQTGYDFKYSLGRSEVARRTAEFHLSIAQKALIQRNEQTVNAQKLLQKQFDEMKMLKDEVQWLRERLRERRLQDDELVRVRTENESSGTNNGDLLGNL